MNTYIKEPKTKRGYITLKKILDSARDLFYEKGYYNTSINDITDRAKIAPGTFYIYFNDKISLYTYLLLQISHDIRKAIAIAIKDCKTRYEMEYQGLKTFLKYIKENPNAYHIIWQSLYINPTLFKEYYERFAERYARGLQISQEKGEVNKNIDAMVASYFLMGVSNFIGLKYVVFEEHVDFEEITKQTMKILREGLFSSEHANDHEIEDH